MVVALERCGTMEMGFQMMMVDKPRGEDAPALMDNCLAFKMPKFKDSMSSFFFKKENAHA
jgi:hypothetical protein